MCFRIALLLLLIWVVKLLKHPTEHFMGPSQSIMRVVYAPWNVATRAYKQPWDIRGAVNPRYVVEEGVIKPVHFNAPFKYTTDGRVVEDALSKAQADYLTSLMVP